MAVWGDWVEKQSKAFSSGSTDKESTCQCRRHKRCRFDPWVRKISWRRKWQPVPIFLPGKFHGQRSLAGYSPWGCEESETTECARMHARMHAQGLGDLGRAAGAFLWLWVKLSSTSGGGWWIHTPLRTPAPRVSFHFLPIQFALKRSPAKDPQCQEDAVHQGNRFILTTELGQLTFD